MIGFSGGKCPGCEKKIWLRTAHPTRYSQGGYEPVEHFRKFACVCGWRGNLLINKRFWWDGRRGEHVKVHGWETSS